MIKGKLTSYEAAKRAGISWRTLQRWIASGKVNAPKPTLVGAVGYRLWSVKHVTNLMKRKKAIYQKGRGRRKAKGKLE
jgi:predicted site-specific integrase-resolvase